MALDPINNQLAEFNALTSDWTLEYLAHRQAEQQQQLDEKAEADRNAQMNTEQEAQRAGAMAGWDQILPGVYKQVKDGKTSYTNVMDSNGIPTMDSVVGLNGAYQAPVRPNAPTDATSQQTGFNFQSMISEIEKAGDPRTKLKMFFDLQEAVAQESSLAMEQAMKQAGSKLGLPDAEALLAQNEALDRADPRWAINRSDSNQTAKQRQLVNTLRSRVNAEAQTYLKSNGRLNAMDVKMQSMAKLLDYDLRQADRTAAREDAQENQRFLRQEQREYQREKDLLELSPAQKARLFAIDPSLAQETDPVKRDIKLADYYGSVKNDPNIKGILNAPLEVLVQAAVMENNEQAERIVFAEEQTRNPSKDGVSIRAEIQRMRQLVQSEDEIGAILLRKANGNKEDPTFAGYNALLMAKKTGAVTKAQAQSFEEQKYNIVRKLLQDDNQAQFMQDVSTWGITDPALQSAVEAARNTSGKTDFNEVAAAYLGGATGPDRAAKAKVLQQTMYRAADQQAKSILTNINPEVLWNQWLLSKARMNFAQRFNVAYDSATQQQNPFFVNPTIAGMTAAAWKSAFPLQSFALNMNKDVTNADLNK